MAYLDNEQMKDGTSGSISGGETKNVVPLRYSPFLTKKGKKMPKHILRDNDNGEELEIVGYAFHDSIKSLNDKIVPGETVLKVECLDNGTLYPDFNIVIADGVVAKAAPEGEISADSVKF